MVNIYFQSLSIHSPLQAAVLLQLSLAMLSLVMMAFDRRRLLGLNVWIKPVKFNLSIAIVLITAAIFLNGLRGLDAARFWTGSVLAVSLGVESLLISLQAARGVRSHLNVSTAFDAHIWMVMGLMAVAATLAMATLLGLTFLADPRWPLAIVWGARLGLLLFLAGSIEGMLMVQNGGHTVGAADGGSGLPVLNWSRNHGDLRIAHFFALHALQACPLLGVLSNCTVLSANLQVAAVFVLSALYTAGVWFLFKLAMQGRPLPLHV